MDTFQALSDPTRRAIVAMLAQGERSAGEIRACFTISAPAVSQHLKVLKGAGLVKARADAQRRIYELDPRGIQEIEAWVAEVRAFWNGRLDALERHLANEAKAEGDGKGRSRS